MGKHVMPESAQQPTCRPLFPASPTPHPSRCFPKFQIICWAKEGGLSSNACLTCPRVLDVRKLALSLPIPSRKAKSAERAKPERRLGTLNCATKSMCRRGRKFLGGLLRFCPGMGPKPADIISEQRAIFLLFCVLAPCSCASTVNRKYLGELKEKEISRI